MCFCINIVLLYRSGSLQVGDVLLAISGQSLVNCTLSDAVHLLQEPEDMVTLKITKETQLLGRYHIWTYY